MNKKISLFGYGKTTKALARVLDNITFYDDNCKKSYKDEDGFLIEPSSKFNPNHSDLEIPSPGIVPTNELIKKAQNLISEYDYFKDTKPFKVWISGTNGKTTTTQMTQHLLKDKGSIAGGNIGTPLALLDKDTPIWILETSSFTMHYTNEAYPNIYALLPITPDHLSWHGDMAEYEKAKLKPLSLMKETNIAIIPKKYKNTPTKAKVITYEDEKDLAKYFNIDINSINFKGAFLFDAILAMGITKLITDDLKYDKMNLFKLDANRQEEIFDKYGRLWVNDTKATNLDATIVAIKRYEDRFIHLILGGDDKGVDLTPLFEFLKGKNLTIYAIGSNSNRLYTLSKKYNIDIEISKNLIDATIRISKKLTKNEVALLSPAAASLDQFKSYAHRGDLFKESILKI